MNNTAAANEIRSEITARPDAEFVIFPSGSQTIAHRVFGSEIDTDTVRVDGDDVFVTIEGAEFGIEI